MPSASSEARLALTRHHGADDGAPSVSAAPVLDTTQNGHRIRARRVFATSANALFNAWTTRAAWQSWMRLRSRSRISIAPHVGGAFRLEIAEGPAIHVIAGQVNDLCVPEFLSLSWARHGGAGRSSTVDVFLDDLRGATELVLVHHHSESRREASWLMRLWSTVLDHLEDCVAHSDASDGKRPVRFRESVPAIIIVR